MRRERTRAHEDAAIAVRADLEIEREHKVAPFLFVDEHVVTSAVRIERAVLDGCPRGTAITIHPAFMGLPVEEQEPALAAFCIGEDVVCSECGGGDGDENGERSHDATTFSVFASHSIVLRWR